jgi:NAD(P) transhydrogenase subunit alpha
MSLTIGIPRELFAGEKRVASVPDVVEKLIKLGFAVRVEADAGAAANFSDEVYQSAGATIAGSAAELWAGSDLVFKVRAPTAEEIALMKPGTTLISFIWPAQNPELLQQLAARKVTVLAMDCLPRTLSRAQKMDSLTSMASISGYRAVIEAANAFGRFFNGQVTAAGKIPPAKVFVAGAGVAGSLPSALRPTWVPWCVPTTPVPKWPIRWSLSAVSSSRLNTRKKARAVAATPRS